MATATWRSTAGWSPVEFSARRPLLADPAMVGLHYGQMIFEGLKAHRTADGRLALFRPQAYALRMQHSAARLAMPPPPADLFMEAVDGVAYLDSDCLPSGEEVALYLRPLLVASEPTLSLRASNHYLFIVLAFVTGGFFADLGAPITVKVEERYARAVTGGTGAAKYAGNYAPTFLAQQAAAQEGCDQVVWLDALEKQRVEELGGMNIFFVHAGKSGMRLSTPPLSDTILPGVTRDSLIILARNMGYEIEEAAMDVRRWRQESIDGRITETFACGTAAVVTPIGSVVSSDGEWKIGDGKPGPITMKLRSELRLAQLGLAYGFEHWIHLADGHRKL